MNYSTAFAALLGLFVFTAGGNLTATELEAKAVWLPEVEELYQSDVEVPSWLKAPTELVVVRGVRGGGDESAVSVAVREIILPELMKRSSRDWTDWELMIAKREIQRWLKHSNTIVKRFEQPFYKTVDDQRYDAFTREALLLDLSEQNLLRLHRRVQKAIQGTTRHWRGTMGLSVGIVGFLFFACWFACAVLDRLTRGYYNGWLRLTAATAFLMSAGLAIHVTRIILRAL